MLQKVTATLFLVVLSLALIACPSDSTTAGPELAAAASQTAITAGDLTEYTLLFDKAVSATGTALTVGDFTIKNGDDTVSVTAAAIVGTSGDDAKKVKLTFASTTFAKDAKVVFTVNANAVKDADGNENAATEVTITVGEAAAAAGPMLAIATSQAAISGGTAITAYTLVFDKEIALVSGKTLADEITMTHDGTDVPITGATIQTADATKVDLVLSVTPVATKEVIFTVAAGAVEDTTAAATKNAETTVTLTVQ